MIPSRRPLLTIWLLAALPLLAQPTALTVNITSREEVRQFYRAIYFASENAALGWTGSYTAGNAGDTTAAFKEATRLRVNFYRALAGVPAGIAFNSVYSRKAQQAAFMESVNALDNNLLNLTHSPPASWRFYTAEGAEGAANSNLSYGTAGPAAINGYVSDGGSNNSALGHRRWLLFPQTLQMGTGDVPGDGTFARAAANALWIVDSTPGGTFFSPRPATRAPYVAYPPAGFVPAALVWPRWSFSLPGADFSAASITMTRDGRSIPTRLEPLASGVGEPTLAWIYDNLDASSDAPHAPPSADTVYTVGVNNVRVGGAAQNFSYRVTVFDPDLAGPDAAPTAVSGPVAPPLGSASSYAITKPAFTTGFEWRTVQLTAFAKVFTAENGLDGLVATSTAGYDMVQTIAAGAGRASYRFAHLNPRSDQILTLPDNYFVSERTAAVSFLSRLAIATAIQTARVQVSTDEGVSWTTLFAQSGTSSSTSDSPAPTESAFIARTVSLADYAGRMIKVRLMFSINPSGIAFLPAPDNIVGWFVDNLTLTGVQTAVTGAVSRVADGTTFAVRPAAAGPLGLQARPLFFGTYPLEWSPVALVSAVDPLASRDPGRITNLSILTDLVTEGETFTIGFVVGGSGTAGSKPVLVRAVGPSLAQLQVADALGDPMLELFAGATKTGENDNWGGTPALLAAASSVAAFPLIGPTSRDAAITASLSSRDNSVKVSGIGPATGKVIAEIYDTTPNSAFTSTTPRLVNVSVLKQLGSGLTAGFVIGGSTAKTVLIRAVGPTLGAEPFNVGGAVADPQISLFNASGAKILENDDWGANPGLSITFSQIAAFPLLPGSRDSALIATLPPGGYSVQVSGANGSTGMVLVELYEIQ